MPTVGDIGGWITENESLLSGIVASTVLACLVISPIGKGIRRLVYAAHLGLVDEAYAVAETARLGPSGNSDDIMGLDGYRTSLLFQANMPELRNDRRCARLCARVGLVEFWVATDKWPDCADVVPYDFE